MRVIALPPAMGRPRSHAPAIAILCIAFIFLSLTTFITTTLFRPPKFADFYIFYAAGVLWNDGANVYNGKLFEARYPDIVGTDVPSDPGYTFAYPPHASVLFSTLAHVRIERAHIFIVLANLCLLALALVLFARILIQHRSLGLLEITLLVSFINTAFARQNVREGQVGLLICVFLLVTFLLSQQRFAGFAGVSLATVSLKPSFLPLYVAHYLLQQKYRIVSVCVLIASILTIMPIIATHRPLIRTIVDWLRVLHGFHSAGKWENVSPDFPYSAFMLHLQPLVYRLFDQQSLWTTAVAWLTVLALCVFAAYLIQRGKRKGESDLLDFGLVSALSLLCVYHGSDDCFLVFPGLLYLYVHGAGSYNVTARKGWGGLVAGVILVLSLPTDLIVRTSYRWPSLVHNVFWRIAAPFHTWACIAVLCALLYLKVRQVRSIVTTVGGSADPAV